MKKSNPSSQILAVAIALIVAISAVYVWLYQFQPLEPPWNDVWTYLIFVLAAALAATTSTMITFQFRKTDKPRLVWLFFSAGLWGWAIAELAWMLIALSANEIGSITLADVF